MVLNHEPYLAAMNATVSIDLVEDLLRRLDRTDVKRGKDTGQITVGTDDDLRVRHALRGMGRRCHPGGKPQSNDRLGNYILHVTPPVLLFSLFQFGQSYSRPYMSSIRPLCFFSTKPRFSFIVAVNSSSSAVSSTSINRKSLICSTRANSLFVSSITPPIRSLTSWAAQRDLKLLNGTFLS